MAKNRVDKLKSVKFKGMARVNFIAKVEARDRWAEQAEKEDFSTLSGWIRQTLNKACQGDGDDRDGGSGRTVQERTLDTVETTAEDAEKSHADAGIELAHDGHGAAREGQPGG